MRASSLAALLLCAAPTAASAQGIEVTAAWGGWSRPARTTWLELDLLSSRGGTAGIRIDSGPETTRADATLVPDTPRGIGLPIRMRATATVTVRWPNGGVTTQLLPVDVSEQPLVAWAVATDPPQRSDSTAGAHVITLGAAALPPDVSAYDAIDALVVDGATVSAMTQSQLGALLGYVARCGPAVLVTLPAPARRIILDAAGCGGDGLSFVERPEQAMTGLAGLQASAAVRDPSAAAVRSLLPFSPGPWRWAILLISAYLCLALWMILFTRRPVWVAGVIFAGTAASWLTVTLVGGEASLGVWSEMLEGERIARYHAVEALSASARGFTTMDLPQFLDEPMSCNPDTPAEWRWDVGTGRFASVRLPTALFRSNAICFRGHFPVLRSARFNATGAGHMRLVNAGGGDWPAGWLTLNGEIHAVPAMRPGQSVEFVAGRGAGAASAVEILALERVGLSHEGLLLPLAVPAQVADTDESRAWLLMRIPRVAGMN